jgi:hypothetical protein
VEGSERTFNIRPRQTLSFEGMSRWNDDWQPMTENCGRSEHAQTTQASDPAREVSKPDGQSINGGSMMRR